MNSLFNNIQSFYLNGSNCASLFLEAPCKWSCRQIQNISSFCCTSSINQQKYSCVQKIESLFKALVGVLCFIPSSLLFVPSACIRLLYGRVKKLPHTDPRIVAYVYKMCKSFDELAQKYGIRYIADSGTLLGIIRHKGFIPWDDDADLQLLVGEEAKLNDPNFQNDLKKMGLKMAPHYGGWKLCPLVYPNFAKPYIRASEERNFCWPFVDIFITKVDPEYDDRIIIDVNANATQYHEDTWRGCYYYTKDQLEGALERQDFGPIQLPIPHNPRAYLTRSYTNWEREARITFDHSTGKSINPPIVVNQTHFTAASFDRSVFSNSSIKDVLGV